MLAATCLLIAEPARRSTAARPSIIGSARALWQIPLYRRAVAGYIAHTAAVGAFAHWGPTFLVRRYGLPLAQAGTWLGAVIVVAGAVGTIVGGRWVDQALGRHPSTGDHDHASTRAGTNALLRICALGVAVAAPFTALAFLAPTAPLFFGLVFVVNVGIFLSTSPVTRSTTCTGRRRSCTGRAQCRPCTWPSSVRLRPAPARFPPQPVAPPRVAAPSVPGNPSCFAMIKANIIPTQTMSSLTMILGTAFRRPPAAVAMWRRTRAGSGALWSCRR